MINIKRLIIFEIIIFIVAGLITFWIGEFTIDRYGNFLILCGIGAMAIAVVSQGGSRQRPMPHSYNPKISVDKRHQKEKEAMQSESKFFLGACLVGSIPVAVGLILKYLP